MNSKVLYIRVNKNCNARCFMCDFWKNPKMEISEDQFRNVLSQFESVELVRFTGGEPLLCDQLPQYIRMCHELGIKTSVITNGLLLEDKLSSLVDNGLNQIIISCVYDKLTRFGRADIKDECRCGLTRMIAEKSLEIVLNSISNIEKCRVLSQAERDNIIDKLERSLN